MKSTLTTIKTVAVWTDGGTTNDILAEAGFMPETCDWFKTDNEFENVRMTLIVRGKLACNFHTVYRMVCVLRNSIELETAVNSSKALPKRVDVDIQALRARHDQLVKNVRAEIERDLARFSMDDIAGWDCKYNEVLTAEEAARLAQVIACRKPFVTIGRNRFYYTADLPEHLRSRFNKCVHVVVVSTDSWEVQRATRKQFCV